EALRRTGREHPCHDSCTRGRHTVARTNYIDYLIEAIVTRQGVVRQPLVGIMNHEVDNNRIAVTGCDIGAWTDGLPSDVDRTSVAVGLGGADVDRAAAAGMIGRMSSARPGDWTVIDGDHELIGVVRVAEGYDPGVAEVTCVTRPGPPFQAQIVGAVGE